jgi:uncharacterized membrane protein YdfJ with MMPL/SSD domain
MRTILKLRWPIAILLLTITIILFIIAPNLAKQAEEAGAIQLPETSSSQVAASILEDAGIAHESIQLVVTLHSKLDDSSRTEVTTMVAGLEKLGAPITGVLNPIGNEQLEKQLVSTDQQTILIPITVKGTQNEVNAVADKIRGSIIPDDLTAYVTGESIINNDVNVSSQEGLKRTEWITVILIFALLLAVFRSIVTPFIPLIAVGISYLLSQSLVAFFIDWFGFPVSNFTQIFLVAILFGIGTDYCILLLSRYKEELSAGHGTAESIINTYRTAGRTLLISGLAVFIGFLAIGFADFPIFKSAVAVAVGIAVLLLVLFTILPLFMMLFKDKLFWPSRKAVSHNESKLWIWMSKLSINRPFVSMLVVGIITIPLLFTYNNSLSFNSVDEISSDYASVQGLLAIEKGFGKGNSLPVQIIIKSDQPIVNDAIVPYSESLNVAIEQIQGVDGVRSITRPTGEAMDIPAGMLLSEPFAPVLAQYTFADGSGMMIDVILKDDPYSPEAIDTLQAIKAVVQENIADTPFESAEIAYGGITSVNSDLADVSSNDFTKTATIMLLSLFVVLAFLFRSLIMPLYMLGSLLLTYFTSIAIAEFIFQNILGYDGISWAVPFFGFILLVALGIDYSIFLLDRFREEANRGLSVRDAIRVSMSKMGTVIITAAIILAGTFGAMMPSGVLSLMQIATIVLIGLLLYGLIILPLLIPAISVSLGQFIWWPFSKKKH